MSQGTGRFKFCFLWAGAEKNSRPFLFVNGGVVGAARASPLWFATLSQGRLRPDSRAGCRYMGRASQVSQMMPNAIPAVQNFEILSISHRKIKL